MNESDTKIPASLLKRGSAKITSAESFFNHDDISKQLLLKSAATHLILPTLYSFRRCPYAMRARMALKASGITVQIREVVLRNKPQELLTCSVKGTVPVLVLADGTVIDESRDIMHWALRLNDPEQWIRKENNESSLLINQLLNCNDNEFKFNLDRYKYADRYPEQSIEYYRSQGEQFLRQLENRLNTHKFLIDDQVSLADIGIFPFIRQFANVDSEWFDHSPYLKLQVWLKHLINSERFNRVMEKYPPWLKNSQPIVF